MRFATISGKQGVYPVVFVDAIHVKIHDGQVANRPIYVVLDINCDGEREYSDWVGTAGEGAKRRVAVLSELRNRGVADPCTVACDALKGLPVAIGEGAATGHRLQSCVVHMVRATLCYAFRAHWSAITKSAACRLHRTHRRCGRGQLRRVRGRLGQPVSGDHPALAQFVGAVHPVLGLPLEIRKVIYTINAVESLNGRFQQATRGRGHFPNEQAALKVLYLVIRRPIADRTTSPDERPDGRLRSTLWRCSTATGSP